MSSSSSLGERNGPSAGTSSALLGITESAVKSLNENRVQSLSGQSSRISYQEDWRSSVISPITVDSKGGTHSVSSNISGATTPTLVTPDVKDRSNNSSTASEILIQSTTINPPDIVRKSVSSSRSTSSATSRASSAQSFGGENNVRRVKVKTKFLREIKSPFENAESAQSCDEKIPLPLTKQKNSNNVENIPPIKNSVESKKNHKEIVGISNRENSSLVNRLRENERKNKDSKFRPGGSEVFDSYERTKGPTSNNKPATELHDSPKAQETFSTLNDADVEATKRTEQVKVGEKSISTNLKRLRNEQIELKPRDGQEVKVKTISAVPTEHQLPRKLEHLHMQYLGKEDIREHPNIREADTNEADIVTVPEQIVTITASNILSTSASDKSSSFSEVEIPRGQPDAWKKPNRGKVLRQGSKVDSSGPLTRDQSGGDEVHIYQYKLNDKQKLLKESFAKRPGGPVKKVVQAQYVGKDQSAEVPAPTAAQPVPAASTTALPSDTLATASAIAASSAVAATQPFFKAQQELEGKIAALLEEISSLKKQPSKAEPQEQVDPREHNCDKGRKVKELEKQLEEVTKRRLDYLERMQQQQMEWQIKLLSVSRETRPEPETYIKQAYPRDRESKSNKHHYYHHPESNQNIASALSPGYINYNRHSDFDIHKPPFQSYGSSQQRSPSKSKSDSYLVRGSKPSVQFISPSKDKSPVQWSSPLDTPAPRKGPPVPTSYERMKEEREERRPERPPYRSGQLLETILSHESPVLKSEHSPATRSRTRQNSDESLQEPGLEKRGKSEFGSAQPYEPAPLDLYMFHPPTSTTTNAPPLPSSMKPVSSSTNYTQALEVLQQVQKSRAHLENNLQNMLRARREDEIYSLMDTWTVESSAAEKTHIKKLVDGYIDIMNEELEKELLDEMAKLKTHGGVSFEEPVKDTGSSVNPASKKVTVPPRGMKGRLSQVQAKINTGRKKGDDEHENENPQVKKGDKVASQSGKTKVPKTKRNTGSKPIPFYQDEEYLARVYGKAIYQNKRTTVKDPYLHFQNDPKPKSPRRPATYAAKGVELKSAKTQTTPSPVKKPGYYSHHLPQHVKPHYYFDSQQEHQNIVQPAGIPTAPIQGQLIPMAVPLRPPRISSGLSLPIAMTTSAIATSLIETSIPDTQPKTTLSSNVAVLTVESEDYKKLSKLKAQVLPSVDIDSLPPTPSTTTEGDSRATVPETPLKDDMGLEDQDDRSRTPDEHDNDNDDEFRNYLKVTDVEVADRKKPESEEEEDELSEPGIALPGYRPQSSAYHGPPFPPVPPPPTLEPAGPSSDILAADLRRRNLLENKAQDWIEQELMARLISQMYPPKPQQPSHHVDRDEDEDLSEVDSEPGPEYLEPLGEDGFQLFVDAGVPVNESLVSGLVKEVLMEKIAGMLGEREAEKTEVKTPVPAKREVREPEEHPPQELVSTPVATPKVSPVPSPQGEQSPAVVGTPVLTPQSSVTEPESEADTTVLPTLKMTQDLSVRENTADDTAVFNPRQDVKTPPITPPLSPPTVADTPPPSVETPPPSSPTPAPRSPTPRSPSPRSPFPSLRIKGPSPPPSPQPWGNPDSPLSEENPYHGELTVDRGEEQISLSVAPNESLSTRETLPILVQPVPVAPPTQEADISQAAPLSEDSSSSSGITTVTETVNQSISEGEWLISKSEGELEDKLQYHGLAKAYQSAFGEVLSPENSLASTLHGTDDISHEKDDSLPSSEGEFVHKPKVPFERDPLIALLAKVQQPILVSPPQGIPQGQERVPRGPEVQRSLGEIRDLDTEKSMGEISQWGLKMEAGQGPLLAGQQSIPEEEAQYKDNTMKMSDLYGTKSRPQPGGRVVSVAPFASSTPERVTVKPRMIQVGRSQSPEVTHPSTRTTDAKQAPGAQPSPVRTSREFPNAFQGTGTISDVDTRTMTPDQINMEALLQSGYLTQTFSSDGGNSDLGHSGNHTRTLSHIPEKPEDGGLNQSGGLTHTLEKAAGLNQSGHLTHTLEMPEKGTLEQLEDLPYKEEKDNQGGFLQVNLDGTGGGGPLKMSVTIPSIHGEDSSESGTFEVSDVSEIPGGDL
ncbi:protein TALPID3 isoform X2 [Lingula anatina]|nr:protein TALPID3 isoform X2 [Lingula anatina]|eukprot:XP_013407678.1 protein TALPID3 isoform X2 [Lingula anatina]